MPTFKEYIAEEAEKDSAIQTREFDLDETGIEVLKKKVEKLTKAANKVGVAPVKVNIGEPKKVAIEQTEMERLHGIPKKYRLVYPVTLTGETPKFDGWTFVGKREPLDGTTSIIAKSAPGHTVPKKYNDDHALTCDHCKKRARRNETFIVKKGKKHMEVGRSCLKDFLGHDIPSYISTYVEELLDLENSLSSFGGMRSGEPMFDPVDVIAASTADIRRRGFVSAQYSSEKNPATRGVVNQHLNPPQRPTTGRNPFTAEEWFKMHNIPVSAEDREHAAKAVEWLKTHKNIGRDEFFTNISKMLQSPVVSLKHTGYLAAGANSYLKEVGEAKKRESLTSTIKKDQGLGKPGEKVKVNGTVISLFSYSSNFGTKYVITVKTDSGHLVKMFTMSGDSGVKKDAKVELTGKIGSVEPESYDRSPFKGMMMTTMAPRSRIASIEEKEAEASGLHYRIGDRVKFKSEKTTPYGVGIITKMVYGKYEISSLKGTDHILVPQEDIIGTY